MEAGVEHLGRAFRVVAGEPAGTETGSGRKSNVKVAQSISCCSTACSQQLCAVPTAARVAGLDPPSRRTRGRTDAHANRIHKLLEDANIKLGVVASDILGVSGREMLDRLVEGEEDAAKLANPPAARMRSKIPQLELALQGKFLPHHRFMLKQLLSHLDHLDQQVANFTARIKELMVPFVDEELQEKLDAVPGINVTTIQNVTAEIGIDMNQFPSDAHIASWTGICPGNEESAGKLKRSRPPRATAGCGVP